MNDTLKPTEVGAIAAPPFQIIALQFLKDASGEAVRIRVNPLGPLAISKAVGMIPGANDPEATQAGVSDTEQMVQVWEMMAPYAPPLIEAACEPRISFATPPESGCLPATWLRDIELMQLVLAIISVSGFVGGAAESAGTFLRGSDGAAGDEDAAGERGAGVVEAVAGDFYKTVRVNAATDGDDVPENGSTVV